MGQLFRGYIVFNYDADEKVETVKPDHSDVWQSRQRLEERLRERLAEERAKTALGRDVHAHVETIETEVLDGDDEDNDDDDDASDEDTTA